MKVLKETSLHNIRHHNFLRTNQFEVENHLNGIEERFHVLNRDGLADGLRERLTALSRVSNNFTPDVLHFLLELSDQPVQKSRLEDLELLREPEHDPGPPLKWEEIAREDQWATDRDLWKNVDFAEDSSDEEHVDDDRSDVSERSEETSLSSVEAQYRRRPADHIVDSNDETSLNKAFESQSWRNATLPKNAKGNDQKVAISELQAVREVLFMLRGLENDLFNSNGGPSSVYQLHHITWESFRALLATFAEAGHNLSLLRSFARKSQQMPLMQVFRDGVEKRLRDFDAEVASIESRLVDIKEDTVVSLVKLLHDIESSLQPLCALSDVIHHLEREKYPHPFRYLELLFDSASIAQMEDKEHVYMFLGQLFFECFQIYLRPIRRWMEDGELYDEDKIFFISNSQSQLPLSQLWQSQFKLRKTPQGILHAPRFLQPAAGKIFTTGKSVVILKQLGKQNIAKGQIAEPSLDFQTLTSSDFGSFVPFSEIFSTAFESWIQSKHHAASATLQRVLFETCNLQSVLSDLHHVYLMVDGYRSSAFAHALFNNLDVLNPKWHDRFLLTEFSNEAFGTTVDSHRITISVSEDDTHEDISMARKSIRKCLPAIKISYRLSWPIRIVVSEESLAHYQAVFTFLLQNRRAIYVLQKHRPKYDGMSNLVDDQASYYGLRSRLLWFYNELQAYLSNLVLAPIINKLQQELHEASDLNAMIAIHSASTKRMLDEACLGSKLDPIRQCMLDIMDLSIRLEDARKLEAEREEEETRELSRLSLSTPMRRPDGGRSGRYVAIDEEEDESFLSEQDKSAVALDPDKSYSEILAEIRAQFDRHLRFICGGLRGVARASGNSAAGKWDTLGEMLEVGVEENLM